MKRIVSAAAATTALALIAPAATLAAHHGHGHHSAHHARRHARRARHAHLVRFGSPTGPSTTNSNSTSTGAPTSTTGARTTPATPSGDPAGKVLSFENGMLTIELTDGSKVSGQVTESTMLICLPAIPPTPTGSDEDDQGGGDDQGESQSGEHGGPPQLSSQQPGGASHDDQHRFDGGESAGEDQDMDGEDGQPPSCTTTALTPGATVREAELNVSSSGAVWERIVLVQ